MGHRHALLFPATMAAVDARTIKAGTPGIDLMERAGASVVRVIRGRWPSSSVAVLAGPGQNGGDGWVVARRLSELGWPVILYTDWPQEELSGDAAIAAGRYEGPVRPLREFTGVHGKIVVDALFGAGLTRDVTGAAAEALAAVAPEMHVVAVDLPSGLDGATGEVLGLCLPAAATVSFHRKKPGHLLGQGPHLCGDLYVADIGLLPSEEDADAFENAPALWQDALPFPPVALHKYARGGLMVLGGKRHHGGAARLAAYAAGHAGAGAVTLLVSPSAIDVYAAHLDAIMLAPVITAEDVVSHLAGKRCAAFVVGPGYETDAPAREMILNALSVGKPAVIDASALSAFAATPDELFSALPEKAILTPHEGEFSVLFPDLEGSAMTRAQDAAQRTGRTILLKGSTSVIATPGEVPILNTHASPWLATAGSGDVLAGIIGALLAQGVRPHLAAAAGAWLHGEAAREYGAGLTADELHRSIAAAINRLLDTDERQ